MKTITTIPLRISAISDFLIQTNIYQVAYYNIKKDKDITVKTIEFNIKLRNEKFLGDIHK